MIDFLLHFFFVPTNDRGKLIIHGDYIAQRYMASKWFWLDIISCVPFHRMFPQGQTFRFVRLLRLVRRRVEILSVCPDFATYFKRTTQAVQRCKNEQQRCSYGRDWSASQVRLSKIQKRHEARASGQGVQFTKLMLIVFLSIHWIACGWMAISDVWRCGAGNAYEWP